MNEFSEWRAAQADDYEEPLRSMIANGEIEPPDEFVLEDGAYVCPHCGTTIGHEPGCTA